MFIDTISSMSTVKYSDKQPLYHKVSGNYYCEENGTRNDCQIMLMEHIHLFSLIDEGLPGGDVVTRPSMNHQERSGQSSTGGGLSSRQISVNSSSLFEDVSYRQVDSEQREEFAQLLKKVHLRSCTRT